MDLWVGPAIVAALVSGLVSALGWFVSAWQAQKLEQTRRAEKVRGFQIALRAEIASDLLNLSVADRAQFLAEVSAAYRADPDYSPVVPRLASNVVFEAIVPEIHVLPAQVIAPVIDYARLRQTVEQFVEDLRAESFRRLSAPRQLTMYSDYLATLERLEALAERAHGALDGSLKTSSSAGDPPTPGSASEPGGAWAGMSEP